jgi:tripeptidyl-peptidase I
LFCFYPVVPFVISEEMKALGVEMITGLSEFPPLRQRLGKTHPAKTSGEPGASYGYVSPKQLKEFYNIPSKARITGKKATQALIEFSPVGGPVFTDLSKFASMNLVPFTNISRIVGPYNQGQFNGESTLDTEYMTAIAIGGETTYITIPNGWQYDFALELFTMDDAPLVSSVSYGWPEAHSCQQAVTHAHCTGTSEQYIARSDAEFLKVANKGLTVIVCSQDEGAPSEANEACQLDSTDPVWPMYPGSSPYVTTISATTFVPKGSSSASASASRSSSRDAMPGSPPICDSDYPCVNPTAIAEMPCMSNNTYYHWTTGGGFSNYTARPAFQNINGALEKYLKSGAILPPTWAFNPNHRACKSSFFPFFPSLGYFSDSTLPDPDPDMSAVGSRILIIQNGQIHVTGKAD